MRKKYIIDCDTLKPTLYKKGGYYMATKPLKEQLDNRRDKAVAADIIEIAEYIWQKITEKFNSFSKFELERIAHISVGISEVEEDLVIDVFAKDLLTESEEKQEKLSEVLKLSKSKMDSIDKIMQIVMGIAKQNHIESWYDDGDDSGFESGDDEEVWGFVWYNNKS